MSESSRFHDRLCPLIDSRGSGFGWLDPFHEKSPSSSHKNLLSHSLSSKPRIFWGPRGPACTVFPRNVFPSNSGRDLYNRKSFWVRQQVEKEKEVP
jgi:hypothetical protein